MPPAEEGYCRGGGPVIPPEPGLKVLGGGMGGCCSNEPGTPGPTEKPQCGQKVALDGTGPWHPGHILVVQ